MVHRHTHLSALTPAELTHLATLLNLPPRLLTTTSSTNTSTSHPSTLWLATQARLLTSGDIPKSLLASHSLLARLTAAAHRAVHPALLAVLCPAHRALNAALVRRVFLLVDAEVTRKTRALRRYLRCPERYDCLERRLSREGAGGVVRELVERLAGMAGLWLAPGQVERWYPGVEEGCGGRWRPRPRVEGGCEACILAAVGGDEGMVGGLWAVLVGRTHARRERPVLSGLVEAWLEELGERGREVRRESEALGRVVKRVRRAVWRWKRGREGEERGRGGSSKAGTSKSGSGSGSARDSGYVSATASGDALSTTSKGLAVSYGAGTGKHALSSSSSCGQQRPRHREGCDDNLLPLGSAVEYDVFLRKRPNPPYQLDSSNTSTHTPAAAIAAHEQEHEDEEEEEGFESSDDLDDAHPDAGRQLHARASGWYSTHTDTVDTEQQHPAFRASGTAGMDGFSRSASVALSRVDTLQYEGESHSEGEVTGDLYDPAQWTDMSVVTRGGTRAVESASRLNSRAVRTGDDPSYWPRVPYALHSMLGSSSSVYSNDGTAVPHPAPSAASSLSLDAPAMRSACSMSLRRYAPSSLVTEWPNFHAAREGNLAATPPITITSSSSSSSDGSVEAPSVSSQHTTGAKTAAGISPVALQSALDRLSLESAALVHDSTGSSEGTVLPEHSVSVVGSGALLYAVDAVVGPVLVRENNDAEVEEENEKEKKDTQLMRRALVRKRVTAIEEAERRGRGL